MGSNPTLSARWVNLLNNRMAETAARKSILYWPSYKSGEMSELAEGARLEIVCAVKSGTEGSNPSLSAIIQ